MNNFKIIIRKLPSAQQFVVVRIDTVSLTGRSRQYLVGAKLSASGMVFKLKKESIWPRNGDGIQIKRSMRYC